MRGLDDWLGTQQQQKRILANMATAIVPEEHHLLQRVTLHDEKAFDVLYTRYEPRLRVYLRRRLNRHDLVDDVLQEVMLVLWQRAATVPLTVPLVSWLFGVARYKSLQALDRSPPPTDLSDTDKPSDADEPEDALLRQDHGRTLARELNTLPHGERVAIELLLKRYSYQEIATTTGDPVSTIRTRVARGCQRLRTRIEALDYRTA